MNDDPQEPGRVGEPAFDDPAFDELRALLADAKASAPVPDDVAARLDATLASLQAERAAGRESVPGTVVVPLRRRLAPRLLVAAAALVVVATGSVGILRGIGDTGGNDPATAESATTSDDAGGGSLGPTAPRSGDPAQELDSGDTSSANGPVQLSSATFAQDAARVMRAAATAAKAEAPADDDTATGTTEPFADEGADGTTPTAPPLTASSGRLDTLLRQTLAACSGPDAPDAVTLAATLDGAPAALVFRPPTDSGQLVEAWSCDGTRLLASATVAR